MSFFDEFLMKILLFDEIEFYICTTHQTCFIKTFGVYESHSFGNINLATLALLNEIMGSDDEKVGQKKT